MANSVVTSKFKVDCDSLLCASSVETTLAVSTDNGSVVVVGDYRQQTSVETIVVKDSTEIASVHVKESFPDHIYSACENRIYLSDRRNLTRTVSVSAFNTDDINHIVVAEDEKFLCSADDSGEVKVVTISDDKLHATLKTHDGVCFCLAVVGESKLISGGYDCNIFVHDLTSNRKIQRLDAVAETNCDSPFINPPYVLGVDASTDGNYLAGALHNGVVCLWKRSRNQKYKKSHVVDDAHSSLGATQVKFFGDGNKYFVTGGNDGAIKLWTRDELGIPLRTIQHGHKINGLQVLQGNAVAVCDTSCELTVYSHTM